MSKAKKNPGSTIEEDSNKSKKDKATSGGGKNTNDGGRPASEIKGGKGNTSGSRGTQGS